MQTEPQSPELKGRRIGDFVLEELIGQGGFGEVYRARQDGLGRQAVVKVLNAKARTEGTAVQRFLREAKLASEFDHPYSAHIYAFGAEPDGVLWIAMEYVRGTTLEQLREETGRIPLDRLVPLFERICEVVQAAHEAGIVHRDIKPSNIMVIVRAGKLLPKLLDFGIARLESSSDTTPDRQRPYQPKTEEGEKEMAGALDQDTPTGELSCKTPSGPPTLDHLRTEVALTNATHQLITIASDSVVGSPNFMAPEAWSQGTVVDRRVDVYALGVLAYRLLTGSYPFQGRTTLALAKAHLGAPVPPLGPGFSADLDAVLQRALAKRPGDRFADAQALAKALRQAAGLEPGEDVPSLDPGLVAPFLSLAPRPIAEALAGLDAASSVDSAWRALLGARTTLVQFLGLLALLARLRVHSDDDWPAASRALLVKLRGDGLTDAEWLHLARLLTEPFARRREVHPVPELVALFWDEEGQAALREGSLAPLLEAKESDEPTLERLRSGLASLSKVLPAVAFLAEYELTVPGAEGRADRWVGTRRVAQPRSLLLHKDLPPGQPVLANGEGGLVLALHPVFQVAEPAPGMDPELFMLRGGGKYGLRLVARPSDYERQDEALDRWYSTRFLMNEEAERAGREGERPPYLGLSAFTPQDAANFFGREREAEAFVNRLKSRMLLAVVGASGAGKSSFVQAGVIPRLPPNWRPIIFRPGSTPFRSLEPRIRELGWADGPPLQSDPELLGRVLQERSRHFGQTYLIVVDQFEELVTLCADEAEQRDFAAALLLAAQRGVPVVLTLRDDFLMRIQRLPALHERLGLGIQLLSTPVEEDLLRIVTEPARRAGYSFDDPSLARDMVQTVANHPGALALLSFTASKLWELRDRHFHLLTRRAYQSLGGVAGALAQHAEETLAALPESGRALVREAFRHLVTSEGTRAVLTRDELRQLLGNDAIANGVVEQLVGSRLVVATEGDSEGAERIEVTHEALLTAWPRLVAWRQEDAENARLRDQLRAAARQWEQRGRPRGTLWRDEALAEYRVWRARYPGKVTAAEQAFGEASLAAERRGLRIRRAALLTVLAVLSAGIMVLVRMNAEANQRLVALYREQGRQALESGDPLRALPLIAEATQGSHDSAELQLLLSEAVRGLEGARSIRFNPGGKLAAMDVSASGRYALTESVDRSVQLWNLDQQALELTLALKPGAASSSGPDYFVRFCCEDRGFVASARGKSVELWSLTPAERRGVVEGFAAPVSALDVFGGSLVAAASEDGSVQLFDAQSGKSRAIFRAHQKRIQLLRFSRDGSRLLTGSDDGTARVFGTADGKLVSTFTEHRDAAFKGELSPDGTRAATGGKENDPRIQVWDVATGRGLLTFEHHTRLISSILFSRAGEWVLSSSEDGTARLWDSRSGRLQATFAHGAPVWNAAFSPDEEWVVTSAADGTVRRWRARTGELAWSYAGHVEGVRDFRFISGGDVLVTAGLDATLRSWDGRKTAFDWSGADHPSAVWGIVLAEETLFTIAGKNHSVRRWSALPAQSHTVFERSEVPEADGWPFLAGSRDGKQLLLGSGSVALLRSASDFQVLHELVGHAKPLLAGAFDREGARAITGSEDHTARLWDTASGRELCRLEHPDSVWAVAFSPDGRQVATGGQDPVVYLSDARTCQRSRKLEGHSNAVLWAAFNPDGKLLATASEDKTARVWDADTGQLLHVLDVHEAEVTRVLFHPAESWLLTASEDRKVRAFDVASGRFLRTVAEHLGGVTSLELSPDGTRLYTGSRDTTVKRWVLGRGADAAKVQDLLRCRVPYQFDGTVLKRRPLETSCRGSR